MHTELARSQRSGGRALRRSLDWAPLLKPVCLAVLLAAAPSGWALPQGGVAVSGQVALRSPQPSTLEILQTSAKAGLDWQSFSIAAGERVLIRQPDASSVLFNRVLGADPSLIFGQLQANGRVFLSNPRGIIFGAGSQVDVGSLVATTLAVIGTRGEHTPDEGGVRIGNIFFGSKGWLWIDESGRNWIARHTPMRRPGAEHELDGALLFLASDASTYVTGTTLSVDGGWASV